MPHVEECRIVCYTIFPSGVLEIFSHLSKRTSAERGICKVFQPHWLSLHIKKAVQELNLRPAVLYPAAFPRFPWRVCSLHPGIFILRWLSRSAHMLLFHLVRSSAHQPLRLVTDKWAILVNQYCLWVFGGFFWYRIQMLPLKFRRMLVGASSTQIKPLFVSRLGHVGRENICNVLINSTCCGFKYSNVHCLYLLTHNPLPTHAHLVWCHQSIECYTLGEPSLKKMEEKKNTHTHCFFGISASRCVRRLGQPSLLPNSYSHQITCCALPGTNSSRKMLKHYLGGHKQLDSLESRPIQTSSNRNDEGGGGAGKKNGRKAELCDVHYKVHLTACSRRFSSYRSAVLHCETTTNLLVSLLKWDKQNTWMRKWWLNY